MLELAEQKAKIGQKCLEGCILKWFDKKRFKYSMISEHKGDEAGIKSCVLKIVGQ